VFAPFSGNAVDKETQNTELGGKEGSFTQKKNCTTNMTRSVTLGHNETLVISFHNVMCRTYFENQKDFRTTA
jgi:hypothetical protein